MGWGSRGHLNGFWCGSWPVHSKRIWFLPQDCENQSWWQTVKRYHKTNMSMSAHNNTSPSCSSPTPNDSHDADLEPSTTNDSNPSTSSANTSATNKRKTFARLLVVEGLGANKTLRNVNSTILDKNIDGATSVSTKREWMGRSVLVEVNHEAYFTNLMKLSQIGDMPVKVLAHRSLNYAKGVVRFRQATEGLTNEDLARDLNMSRRNHD